MMRNRHYQYLFWAAVVVILVSSLIPMSALSAPLAHQDKLQHAIAYAVLYFLAVRAYVPPYPNWAVGTIVVLLGGGIEWAQRFTAYRHGEVLDILANASGVVLIAILMKLRDRGRDQHSSAQKVYPGEE